MSSQQQGTVFVMIELVAFVVTVAMADLGLESETKTYFVLKATAVTINNA